jgi:hypothetical protein
MFNGNDCIVGSLQKLPALLQEGTTMPAWRAFFHLCQASLDTIISSGLPAQFFSALADANLPCLRTVHIDAVMFLENYPDEQIFKVVQQ